MSKQHHFVVYFDTETQKWALDWDVSINHHEGDVWDTKTETWGFADPEDWMIDELKSRLEAKTNCVDCGITLPSGEICQPCQNARLAPVCGDCLYPISEGCNCADK